MAGSGFLRSSLSHSSSTAPWHGTASWYADSLRNSRLARLEVAADLLAADAEVLGLPVLPGKAGAPVDTTAGPDPGSPSGPTVSATLGPGVPAIGDALGVDLTAHLARAKPSGAAGEAVSIPVFPDRSPTQRVVLFGIGTGGVRDLRRAGAALARLAKGSAPVAAGLPPGVDDAGWRSFAEGFLLGSYAFPRRGHRSAEGNSGSGGSPVLRLVAPVGELIPADALRRATITGRAVERARDLANTPSTEKDPDWLAEQARELGAVDGLDVTIRDETVLAEQGFGGILAVGAGSARPPRLIEVRYDPPAGGGRPRKQGRPRHVVLVGKGITFDSGGLSLKPREAMLPMKTDMAAGGAVLAAMAALPELGLPVRVTALVPAAENMPGAAAMRPGDIIRHYGGRTVEVLNTDAEGRLVLADALAYAEACLDPDVIVDLATLTGAASLGLGRRHAALYATDETLAAQLLTAGEASGDLLWRMPLVGDYRYALDSLVADLCHIGTDPRLGGGSITAALFLREFVGRRPWAHLDIAGPARADADEHEVTKGATGFGARLLVRWLESLD